MGVLRIGETSVVVRESRAPLLVPDILYYDNPTHTKTLEEMLKDFCNGEHLLLMGNQVCSIAPLICLFRVGLGWFGLVWFGLVWFGLACPNDTFTLYLSFVRLFFCTSVFLYFFACPSHRLTVSGRGQEQAC